jgi:hypothetical protein
MINLNSIVKGSFPTSAGHRVEFEGKAIRLYTIQGVMPMVEVDTPDGPMNCQIADATVIGTWKAPTRKATIMGARTKVRGNKLEEGMTILVKEMSRFGEGLGSQFYPDHRITMATPVKVTGEPTFETRNSTRWYLIPTSVGIVECPAVQTITVVSND